MFVSMHLFYNFRLVMPTWYKIKVHNDVVLMSRGNLNQGYASNSRVTAAARPSLFPDFGFGCIALRNLT